MDVSVSVSELKNPPAPSTPLILENLPDPPSVNGVCPRRARQQIDLILLAIEALDLDSSEAILETAQQLDLQSIIKNRVALWRLRSTNPMRRHSQRRPLTLAEAKALVIIGCTQARRHTVLIRQLLLAYQQLSDKGLSLEHHFRLSDYLERFRRHFRSRMNDRRAAVLTYSADDQRLDELAMSLLSQLLFCTGTYGMQRFWTSLFDGEV